MHPKTPYFKPDLWSTLETPSRYATGGYHPIEIGDTLHHERYRIIHRLGHGGFSTVWLAEDLQFGKLLKHIDPCLTQPPSAHYVAIKVFTAELPQEEYNTAAGQDRWGQAAMKGRISDLLGPKLGKEEDRCESGREFLVEELDEFEIQGPNGVHKAMVMAFLGPSVRALKYCQQEPPYCFYPFPLAVSRRAVAQCAKALAFLHSKGVVHGDLHSSNIAFALPNLDALSVEELYEHIGQPRTVPFYQVDDCGMYDDCQVSVPTSFSAHQPRYLVAPPSPKKLWRLCCGGKFPDSSLPSIRIIDFTESFCIPLPAIRQIPGTPLTFASPELILVQTGLLGREHITTGIDVWAFACTMYGLLGKGKFFISITGTADDVLADMIYGFGGKAKTPERIWRIFWEELNGKKWFEEDGKPKQMMNGCRTWEQRIVPRVRTEEQEVFFREDEQVVRKMLSAALKWDANERASMLDIVEMIPESWEKEVHISGDEICSSDDGYSTEEEDDKDCMTLNVEEDACREH